MIVRKHNSSALTRLMIDENGEIKETKELTYIISIESRKEYENGVELFITKLLLNDFISVYQYTSNICTLELDCNKVLSSKDIITVITAHDESKFKLLEDNIKQFMITHKEQLK